MKILILGANGILGHTLFTHLKNIDNIQLLGLCGKKMNNSKFSEENKSNLIEIDLLDFSKLESIIINYTPNFLVNCAVHKSFSCLDEKIVDSIFINSILPHKLAKISSLYQFKFLQISTDSVFGNFGKDKSEHSDLILQDLYSATKALGEPLNQNTMILRTSLIGHSLNADIGLLDYVLNSDEIFGFENHIYAGITSLELSKIICMIIKSDKFIFGIYHISGDRISKYDLISLIIKKYNLNTILNKKSSELIDRSLSSIKFKNQFDYKQPNWDSLLTELRIFYLQNKYFYV